MTIKDWSTTTVDAISNAWDKIINFLPGLIGAIVIVIVGLIIATILKWAVMKIVEAAKIQRFFDQISFTEILKKAGITTKIDVICGEFVKWLTIIVFLIPASEVLNLSRVSLLVENVLTYIPNVVIAIIIFLIGVIIANFLAQVVKASAAGIGANTAGVLSAITRYVLYIFVALAAFSQLNINPAFLNVLFTGFVAAVAIGFGLSFGLGGQSAAADLIRKVREDFRK